MSRIDRSAEIVGLAGAAVIALGAAKTNADNTSTVEREAIDSLRNPINAELGYNTGADIFQQEGEEEPGATNVANAPMEITPTPNPDSPINVAFVTNLNGWKYSEGANPQELAERLDTLDNNPETWDNINILSANEYGYTIEEEDGDILMLVSNPNVEGGMFVYEYPKASCEQILVDNGVDPGLIRGVTSDENGTFTLHSTEGGFKVRVVGENYLPSTDGSLEHVTSPLQNPEMQSSIPATVPLVEGNSVRNVEIFPSRLEIFNGEPIIRDEQGEIKLIYKETSGWVMPQFETATTQVFLDWDYTHNEGDNNPDDRELVYSIEPTTDINVFRGDSQFEYLNYRGELSAWFSEIRSDLDNFEITGNDYDGETSLNTHYLTLYTMLKNNTTNLTDAELLESQRIFLETDEEMLVQIDGNSWNFRNGVEIIFDANRSDYATTPSDYATINEDGKLIIHTTPNGETAWHSSVSIVRISNMILDREGIEGDLEPFNDREQFSATTKSLLPIMQDGDYIVPPFTFYTGSPSGEVRNVAINLFEY